MLFKYLCACVYAHTQRSILTKYASLSFPTAYTLTLELANVVDTASVVPTGVRVTVVLVCRINIIIIIIRIFSASTAQHAQKDSVYFKALY